MIATDEDALICDLAEVYGIYEYRRYSALFISTLASGLSDNSRSKVSLSGIRIPLDRYLLAYCADKLAMLAWLWSDDGANGRNRPQSILNIMRGADNDQQAKTDIVAYDSPEDFEAAMKKYER